MQRNIEYIVMIITKHFKINQILALNNPSANKLCEDKYDVVGWL